MPKGSVHEMKWDESEGAKDICLHRFIAIARKLEERMKADVFDYVDPASGLLMNGDCGQTYFEMGGIEHFHKNFSNRLVGMCRVAVHPKYDVDFYPATIFCSGNRDDIRKQLDDIIANFES